jgi:hypothetical protein
MDTVLRIVEAKRKAYCLLILALFEGDFVTASNALQALGYKNTQSERAPERDAEFFEHLFRDANVRTVCPPIHIMYADCSS